MIFFYKLYGTGSVIVFLLHKLSEKSLQYIEMTLKFMHNRNLSTSLSFNIIM